MTKKELWELLKINRGKFHDYQFYCFVCGEPIKENEDYISFVNGEFDYDYDNLINCEDDLSHICEKCFMKEGKNV